MRGCSLLRSRRCVLDKGNLYVLEDDMIHVIADEYRLSLFEELEVASRCRIQLEPDERLSKIFETLEKVVRRHNIDVSSFSGAPFPLASNSVQQPRKKIKVRLDNLDRLAVESFPLCMRSLHQHL